MHLGSYMYMQFMFMLFHLHTVQYIYTNLGDFNMKRTGVLSIPFGVEKAVFVHVNVPLRVFILKRSKARAFVVPFRALS